MGKIGRRLPGSAQTPPLKEEQVVGFLLRSVAPWFECWIHPDPELRVARGAPIRVPARAEPFADFKADDRDALCTMLRRRRRIREALAALYGAGLTRELVSRLYAMADSFADGSPSWLREAREAVTRVHRQSIAMKEQLARWGAPSEITNPVERWRETVATFLGNVFFCDVKSPKELRSRARSLLLRLKMAPSHIALVEVAWLLPVDIQGYVVATAVTDGEGYPYPKRPMTIDDVGSAWTRYHAQIRKIAARPIWPPPVWKRLGGVWQDGRFVLSWDGKPLLALAESV